MDADVDFRLYAEPERVIVGIVEEEVVPLDEEGIITREDGSRCKIINVMKGGERVQVCVSLGDQ
jgi:hypothetical protein